MQLAAQSLQAAVVAVGQAGLMAWPRTMQLAAQSLQAVVVAVGQACLLA